MLTMYTMAWRSLEYRLVVKSLTRSLNLVTNLANSIARIVKLPPNTFDLQTMETCAGNLF